MPTKAQKAPKPAKSETPATPDAPNGTTPFVLPEIPTEKTRETVEIKKLVTDADTQPRVATSPEIVAEYHELIKTAKSEGKPYPLPPIQCVRTPEGKMIVWDGFQRIEANKRIHTEIEVEYVNGDEALAVLLSLSANAAHGSRRTTKDKQNAVKRAFRDDNLATLSDSALAEICAVSVSMVKDHRPAAKSTGVRVSKSGKKIDTSRIGKKTGPKPKTEKAVKADPEKKTDGAEDAAKQTKSNERLSLVLGRVVTKIGGAAGENFRAGIMNESIELSLKELQELSGYEPETIRAILPLILNAQMKPAKAFAFYKSDPTDKCLEELALRAICSGGLYIFEHQAVKITAETPQPAAQKPA
jgi:hypothetical protein